LARLSAESGSVLKSFRPDEGIPAWAFRFLQGIPEVTVTLSGMSDIEQVRENLATFAEEKPLGAEERNALQTIVRGMLGKTSLPCTACRYCTAHCPQKLDIPELIKLYNEHRFTGGGFLAPMVVRTLPEQARPSACIGCKSCEKVCPQQIRISEMMKDFSVRLKQSEKD
ncbi:MAG: 4Fe-4S dicluster domain-containing protein, partial [Clostridia bacterium]|nr:4Fe-4S dicluster domain-containing protein [Clostridia bacterium]